MPNTNISQDGPPWLGYLGVIFPVLFVAGVLVALAFYINGSQSAAAPVSQHAVVIVSHTPLHATDEAGAATDGGVKVPDRALLTEGEA